MDNAQATARLAEADRVERAAVEASRWYAGFLLAFGLADLAIGVLLGLAPGFWTGLATAVLWAGFVAVMTSYALRTSVQARRPGRIAALGLSLAGTFWVLYLALVLALDGQGLDGQGLDGRALLILAAAIVQALPLFVAALVVRKQR